MGLKAWSEELHLAITGKPKSQIYDNFRTAFDSGMKMAANLVFIPGLVGLDEMEGVVRFLAGLDRSIPFHIDGYIPIPGLPWKRPTDEEMEEARKLAERYLSHVKSSHLTSEEALNLSARDDRFKVKTIAGTLFLLSWGIGAGSASWADLLRLVSGGTVSDSARTILLELRLPRLLAAVLAGGMLGAAGGATQNLFRNDLSISHIHTEAIIPIFYQFYWPSDVRRNGWNAISHRL